MRIAEQIVASGTDITHTTPTEREVFVLAAVTAPGDSGAPVVDADGRVVGVMFAYDISRDTTAYALTRSELDAVLGPVLAGAAPASGRHRRLPERVRPDARVSASARRVHRSGTANDPGTGPGRQEERWCRWAVSRPR